MRSKLISEMFKYITELLVTKIKNEMTNKKSDVKIHNQLGN